MRLRLRKYRDEVGAFLAEGADLVAAGLAAGLRPLDVFVVEGSDAAAAALQNPVLGGLDVALVSHRVAEKLSTLQTPADVMAVFPIPTPPDLASLAGPGTLVVYADRVADPGNMGTLVRAAAAFAAAALVASPASVDLFSPKVVRGSMGAVFALPLYSGLKLVEVVAALGDVGVYGLVAHGGEPLPEASLELPAVLCVGAERSGLSGEVLRQTSRRLTIPLVGRPGEAVESLNAGVAGAIALYEFVRRRLMSGSHRSRAGHAGHASDGSEWQ